MNNKILSLDISTKTVGICIMDQNKKLLTLTHISPQPKNPKPENKFEEMFRKVDIVKEFLLQYKDIGITDIVIEEPLISSNNIFTCGILIKFNGMISKVIYDIFKIVPSYLSAYESRKYAFPELMQPRKFKKNGELIEKPGNPVLFGGYDYEIDKKMVIWDLVQKEYPSIIWIYSKNNVLKKESFDMSDSVCVSIGYINQKYNFKK